LAKSNNNNNNNNNNSLIVPTANSNNPSKDYPSAHKLEDNPAIKALGLTETIKKFDPSNQGFLNHEN